jgi:hypothetical protein
MSQPKEANEDLYLKMYEDIDVAINNSANGRITKK